MTTEILTKLVEKTLSVEALVAAGASIVVLGNSVLLAIASVRWYRVVHRRRLLARLGIADLRQVRHTLRFRLPAGAVDRAELEGWKSKVDLATREIYELSAYSEKVPTYANAATYLRRLKFPEAILPTRERSTLPLPTAKIDGDALLRLFLTRELRYAFGLDVALRAIGAGLVENKTAHACSAIQRVRWSMSRGFAKQVLRFLARHNRGVEAVQHVCQEELREIS